MDTNQRLEDTQSQSYIDAPEEEKPETKPTVSIKSLLSISIISLILFISLNFYIFFFRLHKKIIDYHIRSKAIFVVRILSTESLPHLLNNKFDYIQEHVKSIVIDQDILYASVLNSKGEVIAEAPKDHPYNLKSSGSQDISGSDPVPIPFSGPKGKQIGYEVSMQIKYQNKEVGVSRLVISSLAIKQSLSNMKTEIFFVIGFITLIGILIALAISSFITKPILNFVKASEKIARGDFETNIPTISRTEIGLLAESFKKMTRNIRQYQDKIIFQSNELKAIINSMGNGLFTIDKEWRITSFNKAAERITGYKEEEVLGKKCEEVFHSDACPSDCPIEKALKEDTFIHSNDFFIKNKDGQDIPISASTSPLKNETGRIIGGVEVFKDLTELKTLQKQLIQSDKMAALGQMVSGIAHDINNPTGVIHSNMIALSEYTSAIKNLLIKYRDFTQKFSQERPSSTTSLFSEIKIYEKQNDIDYILEDLDCLVEESREAAKRITQIVKDLRDFIHIDMGQLQLVDINQRLDMSLKLIKYNINIRIVKEYSKLPMVYCNAQQIDRVFTNIILNAVQALGSKGEIRIRTSQADERVRISVWDNGPGIPEEIQSKIFDPFFTTKEAGEGTGLGLSICFKIVANHGGKIWVESGPEKGTEFFIELPIKPQEKIILKENQE
ncbi:MAG: ATP-binding protein [bacterium]